jgi:hypothetical protein
MPLTNSVPIPPPELTPGRKLSPWAQAYQPDVLGLLPNGRMLGQDPAPQIPGLSQDAASMIHQSNVASEHEADPGYRNLDLDQGFRNSNSDFYSDQLVNPEVDARIAARSPDAYAKLQGYAKQNPGLYRQGHMSATIGGKSYEATTGKRLQHGVAEQFLDRFVAEEQRARQDKLLMDQRAQELQMAKLPYDAQSQMFDKQLGAEDKRYARGADERALDLEGKKIGLDRTRREASGAPLPYEQRQQDQSAQFGATVLPQLLKQAQASGNPQMIAAVTAIMKNMPGAQGLGSNVLGAVGQSMSQPDPGQVEQEAMDSVQQVIAGAGGWVSSGDAKAAQDQIREELARVDAYGDRNLSMNVRAKISQLVRRAQQNEFSFGGGGNFSNVQVPQFAGGFRPPGR